MPYKQFFSYIMARTSYILMRWDDDDDDDDDDNIRFVLDQLGWIFIVLAHWNNSQRVDMSFHLDTSFWFRANQSLFILL